MAEAKVIPINIHMIRSLELAISKLAKIPWQGPKEFNALFVDSKGFMRMEKLPNPPPPYFEYSERKPMELRISREPDALTESIQCVTFAYWDRVGDYLEYRQV